MNIIFQDDLSSIKDIKFEEISIAQTLRKELTLTLTRDMNKNQKLKVIQKNIEQMKEMIS